MKIFNRFKIPHHYSNSIILIGNFDGVHLGHQKLFEKAREYKKKYKLKIGVITFNPLINASYKSISIKSEKEESKISAL